MDTGTDYRDEFRRMRTSELLACFVKLDEAIIAIVDPDRALRNRAEDIDNPDWKQDQEVLGGRVYAAIAALAAEIDRRIPIPEEK